jgi:uncharacterized Ntn-hydrolase superfamily protein
MIRKRSFSADKMAKAFKRAAEVPNRLLKRLAAGNLSPESA